MRYDDDHRVERALTYQAVNAGFGICQPGVITNVILMVTDLMPATSPSDS